MKDPNSLSNCSSIRVKHLHWDATVHFGENYVEAVATLDCEAVVDGVKQLVLDSSYLLVKSVEDVGTQRTLAFTLQSPRHETFGSALTIELASALTLHATTKVRITYSTTRECTALQWLCPSQTVGKKHPYLFSQCQAIHARSLLPIQDTPSVKMSYTASVTVPTPLTALMSAKRKGSSKSVDGTTETFTFEQKTTIPSYLVALAVGHLEGRSIGPRSTVWSEPEVVDAAASEFEDTEAFISTGEKLLTPYTWDIYDLLLLPGSFPYGGMENPCLTFVTPTLLAGDRSLVDVVAHEIAHSWFGNLVTTSTWEHFWLNEGFTVFLERKIVGQLHGEKMRHFSALIGWKALEESIRRFGNDNPLTALVPNLTNVDPDDSFSSVPYEKGFNLLFYLEKLVGGSEIFEPYLRAHVERFSHRSISTENWLSFLKEYFQQHHPEKVVLLDSVDWNTWFFAPGMPPVERSFDTTIADACTSLANRWNSEKDYKDFSWAKGTLDGFSSLQKVFFIEKMLEFEPLSHNLLASMDAIYHLTDVRNAEVRYRWQLLCLRANYEGIYTHVVQFVSEQGRMKFVRPLYRELYHSKNGHDLAKTTFERLRETYHPIAASMIVCVRKN